ILALCKRMKRFPALKITSGDFSHLIEGASEECFVYLDPPYYKQGPDLYRYSMDHAAHERLAAMLRECRANWALSYDDHPAIRRLVGWAHVEGVSTVYRTGGVARDTARPRSREVVIVPPHTAALTRGASRAAI